MSQEDHSEKLSRKAEQVLYSLKKEGKVKLYQTSGAWKTSAKTKETVCFPWLLEALFSSTALWSLWTSSWHSALPSASLSASLSDQTFLLKASVKWRNNLYSSHSIWIIWEYRGRGDICCHFSPFLTQAPNLQVPLEKLSPDWRKYSGLFFLGSLLGTLQLKFYW